MSCEHPKRVYNKYIQEYIWVPCGECNTCKVRKASTYTKLCEIERQNSLFTMFVTLTYDEPSLPVYTLTGGFDDNFIIADFNNFKCQSLRASRLHDVDCIPISSLDFEEQCDKDLFMYYLTHNGIPYASRSDIQLFNKRLNKWFFDNVTHKYKNFRYFIVSELGSTTLRPHFHALYFVNDSEVGRRFSEAVLACWKYGRTDTQYVENSACSYVAQYLNKLSDLPSFYKTRSLRPFYLASRNPFIGAVDKYAQSDEEILYKCSPTSFNYRPKDSQLVLSQLDKSVENRLFPKCPFYGQISNSLRTEFYTIARRFESRTYELFREKVRSFLDITYDYYDWYCSLSGVLPVVSEFSEYLREKVDGFSLEGDNWLRRLYYLSRKVLSNALRFGLSIYAYLQRIDLYWKNKEVYLLKEMYRFQTDYMSKRGNDAFDIQLMYPEFLHKNGLFIGDVLSMFTPDDVRCQREDAAFYQRKNKNTHFKNMYLESLSLKNNHYYKQLKNYYYAKKRNEISEALAP